MTSLDILSDIQAGKAEFKSLWRWFSHSFLIYPKLIQRNLPKWTRKSRLRKNEGQRFGATNVIYTFFDGVTMYYNGNLTWLII